MQIKKYDGRVQGKYDNEFFAKIMGLTAGSQLYHPENTFEDYVLQVRTFK